MRILIAGSSYAPEETGIAPYPQGSPSISSNEATMSSLSPGCQATLSGGSTLSTVASFGCSRSVVA